MTFLATKKRVHGPLILSTILVAFTLVVGAFLINEIAFFNEGFSAHIYMSESEYYCTFALFALLFVSCQVLASRVFGYRPKAWLLFALLVMLACGIVGVFLFPEETQISEGLFYVLSWSSRLRNLFYLLTTLMMMYLCLGLLPSVVRGRSLARVLALIFVAMCIGAAIYSLATEWESVYAPYFSPDSGVKPAYALGFFNHRNTFGFWLFFGVACLCYLHNDRPCVLWFILSLLFIAELFFTVSKTSIVLCLGLFLVYWTYRLILTFKKHPIRNGVFLGVACLAIGAVSLLLFAPFVPETFLFKRWYSYFWESVGEFGTMKSRIEIWKAGLKLVSTPFQWIFGVGPRHYVFYLGMCFPGDAQNGALILHNSLLDLFLRGGLAAVVLVLGFYVYIFLCLIKLIKDRSCRVGGACLITLLFLLAHGATESTGIFMMDAKALIIYGLTVLPALSHEALPNAAANSEKAAAKIAAKNAATQFGAKKGYVALLILAPIATLFAILGPALYQETGIAFFGNEPLALCLLVLALSAYAFLYYLLLNKEKERLYFGIFACCSILLSSGLAWHLRAGELCYFSLLPLALAWTWIIFRLEGVDPSKRNLVLEKVYWLDLIAVFLAYLVGRVGNWVPGFVFSRYIAILFLCFGLGLLCLWHFALFGRLLTYPLSTPWLAFEEKIDRLESKVDEKRAAKFA